MFLTFLQRAIRFSTVFLFGSAGETLTEKSGNLNLGTPGIMCMGAAGGIIGAELYITSVAFCGGRAKTAGFTKLSDFFTQSFPIAEPNWFETLFLSYGMLVYIAIIIAIVVAIVVRKTRTGLNLRAVGENPATADAAGISVTKYKYVATIIGSMISGLGGLFYIMDYIGGNIEYNVDQYGWMAVALVIFTVWRTDWAVLGSILFSMLYIAPSYISGVSFVGSEAIKMVPYLVTVAVLVVTSIVSRRETQPPASLGLTYFREER